MNLLTGIATKTFNLLSIGQRGVGKTVFLAGSYAELHTDSQTQRPEQLWFDCLDRDVQENIGRILSYVVQTNQYPPPTMKVTNFNFSLKRQSKWGAQTLCQFRWWDIPGEICNMYNHEFRSMVSNSHGCCVFIDAYALVHNQAYLQALEDVIEQVMAIASLVSLNDLKYAFAVILTKCDMLEPGSLSQQLDQSLQPLTTRLDAMKANYQTFYSFIPIVPIKGASTLKAKGAAAPLLWLVWELSLVYNLGVVNNLRELITRVLPTVVQPQLKELDGSLQSRFRPTDTVGVKKKGLYLLPTVHKNLLLLTLAILGFVGVVGLLSVDYERVLQGNSNKLDNLENLANLRQRGQYDQAVPLMEKIVEQKPELLDLRLQLAELYEITGQVSKAEQAYNQILAKQNNNLKALVGKAVLRQAQGDVEMASALFVQAEQAAPNDLKAQVRALAQKTLQTNVKPTPRGAEGAGGAGGAGGEGGESGI